MAKAGLPRLRYLSFANAPVRKPPDTDGEPLRAVESLDAPCLERPDDAARAEAPPARAAEPSTAAAHPREPLPGTAPAPLGNGRAEAAPPPRADAFARPAAVPVDFPLLRAVDEQLRGLAAGGPAGGRSAGHDERRSPAGHAGRLAAPARADFGLAG